LVVVQATQLHRARTDDRQTAASTQIESVHLDADEPRKLIAVIADPHPADMAGDLGNQAIDGSRVRNGSPLAPGHARLLAAIERVFPVRFERFDAENLEQIDGAVILGAAPPKPTVASVRRLVLPYGRTHTTGTEQSDSGEQPVKLSDSALLRRPLRGQAIGESATPAESPLTPPGATPFARVAGRPVWWRLDDDSAPLEVSTFELSELHDGETLREHLQAGRFMGLLPLVHFVEQVLGKHGWTPPPLRAAFVVDDPNIHWTSYGFLDYHELIRHATHHGYHMSFATVPLDGWLVNRRAASLLAANTNVLSLILHGNDHVARELGRLDSDSEAQAAIAQGLRRIAAFERRSGLTVERIIAPPHGACSEAALRATFRLGAEAACISRPYPWRDGQPAATPIAGWSPADLVAGGLPVLPRYPLGAPREDLALRALLGQPLILYGHHGDFAQGLDVLEQAAGDVNALGDVQWGSLGWIARGNYSTRRLGERLLVRMHARRIELDLPHGVSSVRVLIDEPHGGACGHRLAHPSGNLDVSFAGGVGVSEALAVRGPGSLALTLAADAPLDPAHFGSRMSGPWPLMRRTLVETRDRLQALL
jgi:hypothetical protein